MQVLGGHGKEQSFTSAGFAVIDQPTAGALVITVADGGNAFRETKKATRKYVTSTLRRRVVAIATLASRHVTHVDVERPLDVETYDGETPAESQTRRAREAVTAKLFVVRTIVSRLVGTLQRETSLQPAPRAVHPPPCDEPATPAPSAPDPTAPGPPGRKPAPDKSSDAPARPAPPAPPKFTPWKDK